MARKNRKDSTEQPGITTAAEQPNDFNGAEFSGNFAGDSGVSVESGEQFSEEPLSFYPGEAEQPISDGNPTDRKSRNNNSRSNRSDSSGRTTGKRAAKANAEKATQNLAIVLSSISTAVTRFILKSPELDLTEEESTALAEATNQMMEVYNVDKISPKTFAVINLTTVSAGIFIPRIAAVIMKKKSEKKTDKETVN